MNSQFILACDDRHIQVFKRYHQAMNPTSELKHIISDDKKIFICAEQILNLISGYPEMDSYGINQTDRLFSNADTFKIIFHQSMVSAVTMGENLRIMRFIDLEKACFLFSCADMPAEISLLFNGVCMFAMNRQMCPRPLKGNDAIIDRMLSECRGFIQQRIAFGTSTGMDFFQHMKKRHLDMVRRQAVLDEYEKNLSDKKKSLDQLEKDLARWKGEIDSGDMQRSEYLNVREANIEARLAAVRKREADVAQREAKAYGEGNEVAKKVKVQHEEDDGSVTGAEAA